MCCVVNLLCGCVCVFVVGTWAPHEAVCFFDGFVRNALVAFLSLCLQMPRRWNNRRSMVDMVLILGAGYVVPKT